MTVTKLELTHYLFDSTGLTAKESKAIVEAIFDTIRATLATGEDVKLSGFGNFTLRDKGHGLGGTRRTGSRLRLRLGGW